MTNQSSNPNQYKVYRKIARAVIDRDFKKVIDLIDVIPDQMIGTADDNFDVRDWKMMLGQAIRDKQQTSQLMVGSFTIAVILVLALAGFGLWKNIGAIKQQIVGTPTSTVTITTTPSLTPTTTLTPTPTVPPPTETPFPTSAYGMADPATIFPKVPLKGQAYWVLTDKAATAQPPVSDGYTWSKAGAASYWTWKPDVTITWQVDQPINTSGTYAVYYLDRISHSAGTYQFIFTDNNQEIKPYHSTGIATLLGNGNQTTDLWSPVGYYQFSRGQKIVIKTTSNTVMAGLNLPLDDLLIIQLLPQEAGMLDSLPSGRETVFLLDDKMISTYDNAGVSVWNPSSERWQVLTQVDTWGGSFHVRAPGWTQPVQIRYPDQLVDAGKYELLAWIPSQNATAEVTYSLNLNGIDLVPDTPRDISQGKHPGGWLSLGTWDLAVPGKLSIHMDVALDPTNATQIGVDAIALLRVQQ